MFSLLLMGADNGGAHGEERAELLKQQKQLNARVERLTREQDYLVFQRTMYASDSKYLIINVSQKTVQLKYKNRILKVVMFEPVSGRVGSLKPGALTLTQKIEGTRRRNLMVFEEALVLQGMKAPPAKFKKGMPRFTLSKRNFKSLYAALASGAKAYILP